MELAFKNPKIFSSFASVPLHARLVDLLAWLTMKRDVVITSAFRPGKIYAADSGIHSTNPLRAVDIRSYIYSDPQQVCERINYCFQYDPSRPQLVCALFHNTGKGDHIHLQVHELTAMLERERRHVYGAL